MKHDPDLQRRRFLQFCAGGLAVGGVMALGCNKNSSSGNGSGTGCDSPIDDQSKQLRTTLKYVDESTDATRHCNECLQFQNAQYGECGGCKLITGPVRPNGSCLSFTPKTAAPAKSG